MAEKRYVFVKAFEDILITASNDMLIAASNATLIDASNDILIAAPDLWEPVNFTIRIHMLINTEQLLSGMKKDRRAAEKFNDQYYSC